MSLFQSKKLRVTLTVLPFLAALPYLTAACAPGAPTTGSGGAAPSGGGSVGAGGIASTGAGPGSGGSIDGTGAQPSGTGGEQTGGGGGSGSGGTPQAGGSGGGASEWWFDGPRTPPPIGTWPPPAIKLTEVVSTGATQPTAIAAPRADTSRLFFTEKWGRVRLIKDGVLQETPALDIRDAVLEGGPVSGGTEMPNQGKRGLVGLAFHPDYETNGRVFVMYTADQGIAGYGTVDHSNVYDDGDMTIEEYRRSDANPDVFDPAPVGEPIVQWDKGNCDQCSQHNGGSLEIDVDGFLWASSGDPPPYTDSGSQDLMNLNGKLLKFDISGATVTGAGNYPSADPIVANVGIRNAYKFSIDRYTGDIYVGDVGETLWEEITVQEYGDEHRNHGWPGLEGTHGFRPEGCSDPNCLGPVYEYNHKAVEGELGDNCVIGGYVYRGAAIPGLQGAYLYGDYGAGVIRAIQVQAGAMTSPSPYLWEGISVFMGCFGEDAAGELYVCDYNNNKILRVDAQ